MQAKKYTTVAEVARAIGANYYGLTLLQHLDRYYPDLALDYEFIKEKADHAAEVAADYVSEHGTDKFSQMEARNRALDGLLDGFGFSKFEVVFMACAEILYAALGATALTESHEAQQKIVMPLMPKFEPIFEEYPLEDSEFPASCEYDEMMEKLTKKAAELMQPVVQAARDKADVPF